MSKSTAQFRAGTALEMYARRWFGWARSRLVMIPSEAASRPSQILRDEELVAYPIILHNSGNTSI